MPASWEGELAGCLKALDIPYGPPPELVKLFRRLDLASNNRDDLTLDYLHRLADVAVEMMGRFLPDDARESLQEHLQTNTPASHLQLVSIILTAHKDAPYSVRANAVQLVFATRVVDRDAHKPNSGSMSPIDTGRFLAMWSTVYWAFAAKFGQPTADSMVYWAFGN